MTRYLVRFDRISRDHDPAPLETVAVDAYDLAQEVHRHARQYVVSRDFDVLVNLETGTVHIGLGRYGSGTITVLEDK